MSAASDPAELVFAYGSLMFPKVCEAVIGRVPQWSAAHVEGWMASGVPGALYPALVREPGAVTDGLLLEGISPSELARLDDYEGPGFRRRRLTVQPGPLRPWVWVATDASMTTGTPWDPTTLESRLSDYLGL